MIKLFKFKSEINLTDGDTKTLIKKFIIYALPIIAVGILELLYNSFDLIVVQQKEGTVMGAAVGAVSAADYNTQLKEALEQSGFSSLEEYKN